jgi:hypothetical protein
MTNLDVVAEPATSRAGSVRMSVQDALYQHFGSSSTAVLARSMRSSVVNDSVALGLALCSTAESDSNTEGRRPARENARRRTPRGMNPAREKESESPANGAFARDRI